MHTGRNVAGYPLWIGVEQMPHFGWSEMPAGKSGGLAHKCLFGIVSGPHDHDSGLMWNCLLIFETQASHVPIKSMLFGAGVAC
jgi:hypothetical protein